MAMSVALVSASREIRSSFATVIAEAPEVTLAGIAGTMPDLRTLVQETPELDVIVVDAGLTDTPALEVVHELGLSAPLIATLVIGGQGVTLAAVVASGARGMLTLPLSLQEVQAQLDTAV
ncbi:MAG: hypothetical protein VB093_10125, partial [Propionicimonas sp.]|nr:hypothetical protein [Propionicimonas sp.]